MFYLGVINDKLSSIKAIKNYLSKLGIYVKKKQIIESYQDYINKKTNFEITKSEMLVFKTGILNEELFNNIKNEKFIILNPSNKELKKYVHYLYVSKHNLNKIPEFVELEFEKVRNLKYARSFLYKDFNKKLDKYRLIIHNYTSKNNLWNNLDVKIMEYLIQKDKNNSKLYKITNNCVSSVINEISANFYDYLKNFNYEISFSFSKDLIIANDIIDIYLKYNINLLHDLITGKLEKTTRKKRYKTSINYVIDYKSTKDDLLKLIDILNFFEIDIDKCHCKKKKYHEFKEALY